MDDSEPSILASQPKKYDVFINFRGEDTRRTIVSFLDEKFKDSGIDAYIDDRLERGEEISKALLDAIDHSKFSVVIFSKNYATSPWCLNELDHILECAEKKMHLVLPVFYDVDPTNVRKQTQSYADAFLQLDDRFPVEQIQKWRTALTKAANLSGWDSSNFRNDAELVEKVVKHIRGKLKTPPSINYLEQGLVGMPKRVEDVKELLKNGSKVGICGMGGLGKTTLAKAVFNECWHQFDLHCFFLNVREEIEKNGKFYLEENGVLDGVIKKMLQGKKLLLVLDDVDSLEHCKALLNYTLFNSETKVIITSRDKQVLRNICNGNENIYDLELLDQKEALELFSLCAFKRKFVEESYIEISREFVDYAKGVPLALKVLGSHLFKNKIEVWQSLLSKLKHVGPDQGVLKVLKISFDGLEEQEKSIFLDIACFFRGEDKYFVKDILNDGGSFDYVIRVLVDKCLLTISKSTYDEKEILEMHDLLQEMGHTIARGSHGNYLENYSRLWKHEDIYQVLRNNTATTTIEGVFQVAGYKSREEREVINLDPSTFTKVPRLRLLKLLKKNSKIRFEFPDGFHGTFPNPLRYLEWYYYPVESLGPNFKPHNLVYLSMVCSQLKKLWNETQDVKNLKYVNLSHSTNLTCLPNLSKANLQMLRLHGCTSLVDLPPLRFHDNGEKESEVMHKYNCLMLQFLNHKVFDESLDEAHYEPYERQCQMQYYKHEKKHEVMAGLIGQFKNIIPSLLDYVWTDGAYSCLLDLKGGSNLRSISAISGNIKFICLRSTAIEELHSSIGFLKNLLVLDLCNCKCIKDLPTNILNLESLEYLDMFGCVSIKKFPKLPKSIKGLDLSRTLIQKVDSSSFECLPCLRILYMNSCTELESLPTTICKLKSLEILDLGNCLRLKSFPEILEPMEKIEKLSLNGSGIEEIPSSIENFVVLDKLILSRCYKLKCIPTTIWKLKYLTKLFVDSCWQLKSFPEILQPVEKLHTLHLNESGIEEIPSSIQNLVVLDELILSHCENLKCIPTTIWKVKSLTKLCVDGCSQLKSFPEILEPMEKLHTLYLSGSGIEVLPPSIERLVKLKDLSLCHCKNLKSIPTNIYNMCNISEIYTDGELKKSSHCGFSSLILSGPSETTISQVRAEVQQSTCRNSCSITNINVLFRLYYSHGFECGIPFSCCECFLFYSLHNILATQYFQDNIFQMAPSHRFYKDLYPPRARLYRRGGSFSYSGNAVPEWCTHQFMGSSIDVNWVPSSDKYFSFLGFAMCIAVDFDQCTSNPNVDLYCEYHFKRNDGQSSKFYSILPRQKATHDFDGDSNVENNDILNKSSGYVFIWYLYDSYNWNGLWGVDKVFFEFHFGGSSDGIDTRRIKQCGVRLVYREDAKEFDRAQPLVN